MLLSSEPILINTMASEARSEEAYLRIQKKSLLRDTEDKCSCPTPTKRQRLSIDAISTLTVQTSVTCFSGVTRKGYAPAHPYKKNQDALVVVEHPSSGSIMFACLDGHGEFGDIIAQYFKNSLETRLCCHPMFIVDPKVAIQEVVSATEKELLERRDVDTRMSGTTLVLAIVRGRQLLVANVGDSRVILGSRNELNEMKAERLSVDHKPDTPSEMCRILENGGRVSAIKYEDGKIGPARVWLGRTAIPGLAMSRALGDTVAHMAGVTSCLDFFERELDPESDRMLVLATDGLWEFTDDQETIEVASTCSSPSEAILKLINVSNEKWLSSEHIIDDTTICVAFLGGS